MREKCARVLAAALMTGAIGFALAMPAFFGSARDASRSPTAPPSSLQRSVHLVASALSRPARAEPAVRLAVIRSHSVRTSIPVASPSSRHSSTTGRSKPNTQPDTKPAPAPAGRQLANDTVPARVVSPPAPTQPEQGSGDGPGKGKGKGKGHDKNKDKTPQDDQPPVPATTPAPVEQSQNSGGEKDHGQGNGHDKGHDK
jgi:hypothetical protein